MSGWIFQKIFAFSQKWFNFASCIVVGKLYTDVTKLMQVSAFENFS